MYRRTIEGKVEDQSDSKIEKKLKCYYDHPEMGLVSGQHVSNPTTELISAEGWEHYEPEPVPPQPIVEPSINDVIKAMVYLHQGDIDKLSDDVAVQCKSLFPTWISYIGQEAKKGIRLYYNEHLYRTVTKVLVVDTDTPDKSENYLLIG